MASNKQISKNSGNLLSKLKRFFLGRGFQPPPKEIKNDRMLREQLSRLEKNISYTINNPLLFVQSLKHRSYLNVTNAERITSYERLEFLGDSILNMIVSENLFRQFPDKEEGELTKCKALLVNKKVLAHCAERINLGEFVLLSEGEQRSGGRNRPSILSDVLESLIGAIYLDSGFDHAKAFIQRHVLTDMMQVLNDEMNTNFKGELLEFSQSSEWGMPHYVVISETGPEHSKQFTVEVKIKDQVYGMGKGMTKKDAEQQAAREALKKIKQSSN